MGNELVLANGLLSTARVGVWSHDAKTWQINRCEEDYFPGLLIGKCGVTWLQEIHVAQQRLSVVLCMYHTLDSSLGSAS